MRGTQTQKFFSAFGGFWAGFYSVDGRYEHCPNAQALGRERLGMSGAAAYGATYMPRPTPLVSAAQRIFPTY